MRILHVIPGLTRERGGPTVVVQALTRHQSAAGHDVTVLTTDQGERHGENATGLDANVRVERFSVRGPDRLSYSPDFAGAARTWVNWSDVVHVHSIFTYPVHAALREAERAGKPVVLRPCGLLHPYSLQRSRWVKRVYLTVWGRMVRRSCSAWHYTSDQEAADSWPGDTSPRFILPNGIEPTDFDMDEQEARALVGQACPGLGDKPYVLFLGRLHAKKRLDLLLEAFLAGAPPDHRLIVAGPDEARIWEALSGRFLNGAGKRERVLRLGMIHGRLKVALLTAARLFALPSEHENFGIAALEALAAGTPVLLSPYVDLATAAEKVGVGFVAPLEPAALGKGLADILSGSKRPAGHREKARTWVRARYGWSRIAGELTLRYQWVAGGCTDRKPAPDPG
jgi:glycosyltransferase involved in cell wall biosynthesis